MRKRKASWKSKAVPELVKYELVLPTNLFRIWHTATRQRKKNKTGQIRADRESESVRLIRDRRYVMAYVYPFDGRMVALRGIRLPRLRSERRDASLRAR